MTNTIAYKERRGIHNTIWRRIKQLRNKTIQAPFGLDDPEQCWLGRDYWHNYPIEDFDYKFNNWGCRGPDYDQFLKEVTDQKVNICIGDSYTLNLGGPQEHSWPHLLEQLTGIPSVNVANDGMSSYYFQELVNKTKGYVNANHVFVLYNALDDSESEFMPVGGTVPAVGDQWLPSEDDLSFTRKLKFLKEHCWVHDAYWQFIPPSLFSNKQKQILYQYFPTAHDFLKNTRLNLQEVKIDLLLMCHPLRGKYNQLAGPDWMSYDEFCMLCLRQANVLDFFSKPVDKRLVQTFLTDHFNIIIKCMLLANRDGLHMNKQVNQQLADYFYQQSLTIKPSPY